MAHPAHFSCVALKQAPKAQQWFGLIKSTKTPKKASDYVRVCVHAQRRCCMFVCDDDTIQRRNWISE